MIIPYLEGIAMSLAGWLGPPEIIARLFFSAVFGSVVRVGLAAYLKYEKDGFFTPSWKRIGIEMGCAASFGSIGAWLIAQLGTIPALAMVGTTVLVFVGGLVGPHLLIKAVEELGAEKLFEDISVTAPSNLPGRQQKALDHARAYSEITNRAYRAINAVSDSTAEHDLNKLVGRGLLKRQGSTKGTRYLPV